jgi:hypothetical protein
VSEPVARGFIPPRPNLGPEPWPEDQPTTSILIALAVVACLLLGWFVWRHTRRRRAQKSRGTLAARDQTEDTPRGRLLALSHSMREALAVQFGAPWRAKTTEELSADAQLEQVLGREDLRELIRFLDQVDRLKFAPERSNDRRESLESGLAAWQPRVEELEKKIQAKVAGGIKAKNERAAGASRSERAATRRQPRRASSAR